MATSYLDGIARDWAHTPGVVDLVHFQGGITQSGIKAHIDPNGPSWREVNNGGPAGIEPTDCVWIVWAETMQRVPRQGDMLTDEDEAVWTLLSFSPVREEGRVIKWRCVCRQQVAA